MLKLGGEELSWLQIITSGGTLTIVLGLIYAFYRWELKPQKQRDQKLYDDLLKKSEEREKAANDRADANREMLQDQGELLHQVAEATKQGIVIQQEVLKTLVKLNERVPPISSHVFYDRPAREAPADD